MTSQVPQHTTFNKMAALCPAHEVLDQRYRPLSESTNRYHTLDVYIPDSKVGFPPEDQHSLCTVLLGHLSQRKRSVGNLDVRCKTCRVDAGMGRRRNQLTIWQARRGTRCFVYSPVLMVTFRARVTT